MKLGFVTEVENHVEVRFVFIEGVKIDDVRVRGEKLNDLGLSKEALSVQGVSGGTYGYLVNGFNGVELARVRRRAPIHGTESSPADLFRNDVVSLEVFTHHC